ncbi:MAG: hypothetical protein AAGF95_25620 [Chloroflexota bacterium]
MSTAKQPLLEIDHVYIMVTPNAPEAAYLQSRGLFLLEDTMHHEGQGTASCIFLFKNMYLELAWVHNREMMLQKSAEVGFEIVLSEPWQETGASPFGVGLRYTGAERTLPFATKKYHAEWMPPSEQIDVIPKTLVAEPAYFMLSDGLKHLEPPEEESTHSLGIQNLTHLAITVTCGTVLSPATEFLITNSVLQIKEGSTPMMELTFDGGTQKESVDCRPTLPLMIYY